MGSQFYARYVPPSSITSRPKQEDKGDEHVHVLQSNKKRKRNTITAVDNEPQSVTEPGKADDEGLQNRVHPREESGTQTKFVRENEVVKMTPVPLLGFREPDHSDEPKKIEKKKKRKEGDKEKEQIQRQAQEDEASSVPENQEAPVSDETWQATKHKSVRQKYDRSNKLAAKLVQKSTNTEANSNQENNPVEEPVERHGLVPIPQPESFPDETSTIINAALPDWLARPVYASAKASPFKELPLSEDGWRVLEAGGFQTALPIQSTVIPMLMPGPQQHHGDVCIAAATGSGKTLAYLMPMVEALKDESLTFLRGLIVVPTRELVEQVKETLHLCITGTSLKVATAVGSKSLSSEKLILVQKSRKYLSEARLEEQDMIDRSLDDSEDLDDDDLDTSNEMLCGIDYVVEFSSKVDILICTPGRLVDHLRSTRGFSLQYVQWLVIDEADRLLDQSFQQWIEVVVPALHKLPTVDESVQFVHDVLHVERKRSIQKIILSATMTKDLSKLMSLKLNKPALVTLQSTSDLSKTNKDNPSTNPSEQGVVIRLPENLREFAVSVKQLSDKPLYLISVLEDLCSKKSSIKSTKQLGQPGNQGDLESITSGSDSSTLAEDTSSSGSDDDDDENTSTASTSSNPRAETPSVLRGATLIFTNTNENALRLARLLVLIRPGWAFMVGSLTKSTATARGKKTLSDFRNGRIMILVASDRASRGLDVDDLDHVINYDMPTSITSYVHRIGRTARAGKKGAAVTLVAHHEGRWFWNEIDRSEQVYPRRRIARREIPVGAFSDGDRNAYETALRQLGEEARGEHL